MSTDMYHRMSVVHTEADQKVEWRDLEDSQKEIRSHARALAKMVRLGESAGKKNKGRCYGNVSWWPMDPPILRAVAKTHKEVGQDGRPKSRPICDGSQC